MKPAKNKIKNYRGYIGMTQVELAQKIGKKRGRSMSQVMICHYELGNKSINDKMKKTILSVFNDQLEEGKKLSLEQVFPNPESDD